jgi:hypothetical protein
MNAAVTGSRIVSGARLNNAFQSSIDQARKKHQGFCSSLEVCMVFMADVKQRLMLCGLEGLVACG